MPHTASSSLLSAPQGVTSFGAAPLPAFAAGETSLYDFTVQQYGAPVSLDQFRGKARAGRWMLLISIRGCTLDFARACADAACPAACPDARRSPSW
jgi:hypothetical protein